MQLPPRLPPDEEQSLIASMLAGDRSARDKLIEHGMVHAYVVAKHYHSCGIEWEDRFSLACMGLVYAVDHFNPDKGNSLRTNIFWAAGKYLNNEIRARQSRPIFHADSLDRPVMRNQPDSKDLLLSGTVKSDAPDPGHEAERAALIGNIKEAINSLPDHLRSVMQMRYLDDPPMTQKQVAERLGVGQMTVSRREKQAIMLCRGMLHQ